VIRHIRVRTDLRGEQRGSNSGFIIENSRNVILDHVSASWALDENVGGYGSNDTITISWSIFAEGVPRHDKCALLSSDPTGPQRLSFVRNLCAHNGDRNPDVNFPPGSCVEVINNVLYDASSQFTEVWESYGGTPANIVGNYYRQGPSTAGRAYAIDRAAGRIPGKARIYQTGNVIDGDRVTFAPIATEAFVDKPVCPLESAVLDARAAYARVLDGAGAFPHDSVDTRIVEEVRTRKGKIGRDNRVLPVLRGGTPYVDTDGDGMSDAWERRRGLDPKRNDAWGDVDGNGWSNLEEFLNHAHEMRMAGRRVR
jgi:pectate lyase